MEPMGRFIVIDGGEGSGKGVVMKALKAILTPEEAIFTREPGGSPLAEMIRGVIFSEEAKGANALTNFALFWAARADHMARTVYPALMSGISVVSDRFDISTFAYQLHGQRDHNYLIPLFWDMREKYCAPPPDLYIYLDVDPEEGLRRARGRGEGNHYDDLDLEFHQRVREGYLNFVHRHPDSRPWITSRVVDANLPESVVVDEVTAIVLNLIRPQMVEVVR
jgi:dTMP kinase